MPRCAKATLLCRMPICYNSGQKEESRRSLRSHSPIVPRRNGPWPSCWAASPATCSNRENTWFPRPRWRPWAIRTSLSPSKARRPMSSNWRRFEVLLPLQFNDGNAVPGEWLAEAVLELVDRFAPPATDAEGRRALAAWRRTVPRRSSFGLSWTCQTQVTTEIGSRSSRPAGG